MKTGPGTLGFQFHCTVCFHLPGPTEGPENCHALPTKKKAVKFLFNKRIVMTHTGNVQIQSRGGFSLPTSSGHQKLGSTD